MLDRNWLLALRRTQSTLLLEPKLSNKTPKPKTVQNKPTNLSMIDYEKTYQELRSHPFLLAAASQLVQPTEASYLSAANKALVVSHWARILGYNLVLIAGQYINRLVLACLALMEVSLLAYLVYCYVKYKYLKNII